MTTRFRGFHGMLDTQYAMLSHWRVTQRENIPRHIVTHSRQLLYEFRNHFHPYAERLVKELVAKDIEGLEALDTAVPELRETFFDDYYKSTMAFTPIAVSCVAVGNELHLCSITDDGRMYHTIRHADGTWQSAFGDVKGQSGNPGKFVAVGCASVDNALQVCGITDDGGMFHTFRRADGTWQGVFGDVRETCGNPGRFIAVGCAGVDNTLQVCGITDNGGMFYTSRAANGTWEKDFSDVKKKCGDPGKFTTVSCAGVGKELQVCGITMAGGMFHTIRNINGTWQNFSDDGKKENKFRSSGKFIGISCAGVNNELQVCSITDSGGMLHTIRKADGKWQNYFGDVKGQSGNPGKFISVSCAEVSEELHVACITNVGGMNHTIRYKNQTWQHYFGDVIEQCDNIGRFVSVGNPLPVKDLDFDYAEGAYAVYNWEVFFHVPYTIGVQLSKNQRFAEAQRWFHYIFDPTASGPGEAPKRFWKVKPFRIDEVEHVENTLFNLSTGDDPELQKRTIAAIGAWRDNPFRPHLIARTRPTAYMYATVMAYLDNLIAWGDSLFRQDTRESINEAMQYYVLAANILGPNPQAIPKRGSLVKQTYASLRNDLDEFGNTARELEPEIAFDLVGSPQPIEGSPEDGPLESIGRSLYFCVPRNDKLLGYWTTVADRLFKIRNSLNLQGVFRQLPLFPPPIDPAMLARAVAAGVDVASIIAGTAAPLAPVRFQILLQKAVEICQEVKSLGGQILSAIEKKDNEALSVLRAKHESNLLGLVEVVRYAQWQEAVKNREGVVISLQNAFQRFRYYDRLLGTEAAQIKLPEYSPLDEVTLDKRSLSSDEPTVDAEEPDVDIGESFRGGGHKINPKEARELTLLEDAQIVQDIGTVLEGVGAVLNMIPEFHGHGTPLGLGLAVSTGGTKIGHMFQGLAATSRGVAGRIQHEANMAGKMASYDRREQEWAFQRKAAAGELTQLFKQYRAAELREHIAKHEYENHQKQIAQAKDVEDFLTNEKRKTTTQSFYLWMKREAQGLHAQCFQFAYDISKKAERALQHEIGDPNVTFIKTGYLSGLEGLFAGEKLYLDLKRMEIAYAELNTREFEITKHVSLRDWFPLQLLKLRSSGKCEVRLPEALFDLDCPGHNFRRIKSVAVTIPCVVGPYANVNCSLTLAAILGEG
ncbi:MAG: hypothetical protein V2B19_18025 [Pseudomonadota bacterium]